MNIDDVDLIKLLPQFMQNDPMDIGLAKSVSLLIRQTFSDVKTLRVWDQYEMLNEKQCDELAYELDVDWYDSTADIDTKRQTLKYAMEIKRKRGTAWSVQSLITSYFGEGFIMEFPDFNGKPYEFMAMTTNESIDEEALIKFKKAVDAAKNERSKLVGVLYYWSQGSDAAELVSYDDKYHRYEIKRCGLTPHATTVGILGKGIFTEVGYDSLYDYTLVPVDDDICGTLGGHRGTLGKSDRDTVEADHSITFDLYGFNKSGTKTCDDTVGTRDTETVAGSYDDSDHLFEIKRVTNKTLFTAVTSDVGTSDQSAISVFTYKRCGLYRCTAS